MHFRWYYKWHTISYASFVNFIILVLFCATAVGYIFIFQSARAATVTWDGGGTDGTCGGTAGDGNHWSCAFNWSGDVQPGSGDAVVFNATSTKDANIDPGFAGVITSLTISTGYTGTITQTRSLQTSGVYSQADGFYSASDQTLDINGAYTLSAGTFTASSGTTSVAGALTISGVPIFNANGGTFTFDVTTAALSCNNATFNLVTFTGQTGLKTVNSNCSLPLGAAPTIPNSITLNGTLSGSGTLTTTAGTFTLNSGSVISGFSGLVTNSIFTVAGATVNLSSYTTVDMNSTFNLTSGTFTAPSGTLTLAGALTISGSPTFNANGGTVTFDGSTTTLSCNNVTFNAVVINNSGLKTINSNCSLPLGNNPTFNSITLNGTLSGSGTVTNTTGTVTLNAGATLTGFSGWIGGGSLTIAGATVDFGSYTTVDLNSTFILSSGGFTAPSGTMTIAGALTISGSPTFNANGGTVTFDGGSANLGCNNVTFNLVIFNNTAAKTVATNCSLPLGASPTIPNSITLNGTLSGTGTLTASAGIFSLSNAASALSGFSGFVMTAGTFTVAGANLNLGSYTTVDLNGAFTITSGTFTAPTGTMTLAQGLTISGSSTFNANGGTFTFDGGGATLACNNVTFNLVVINNTSTKTVATNCSLPLGASPTISNSVTLNGILSGTGTLTNTTGTLTLNTGAAVSGFSGFVGSNVTIAGMTTDLGSSVDINGNFTFSSGTFTAPSGTMTVAGGFTLSGASVFNANGGTIIFDGGAVTLNCNNVVFNLVIFNNSGTKQVTNNCSFPLGNNPTIANSVTMVGGTLSGSGTLTTAAGNLTLNVTTIFSGFNGLVTNGVLTDAGMNLDLSSYTTVDINNSLVINSAGVFTAPTGTMTLAGGYQRTASSTFNHNNGTVVVDGTTGTMDPSTSDFFNNLTFAPTDGTNIAVGASDTLTVLGTLTLTEGAINQSTIPAAGTIEAQGNIVQQPTFDGGTGKIIVNGTGNQTLTGNATESTGELLDITFNKTSSTLFLGGTIRTSNPWNFTAGAIDATTNDSTVVFAGDQTIAGAYSFDNVILIGDTQTKTLGSNLDINGNLTIAGTFDVSTNNYDITIAGNWSLNSLLVPRTGTVTFDGADQTISGSTSFYNLTKKVTAAATLTFEANTTQTVTNALDLEGMSGQLLTLRSSTDGSQWMINPQALRTVAFLDVKDSNNSNVTDIDARNSGSIDSSNNNGWLFDTVSVPTPTSTATATPSSGITPTLDTEVIERTETVIDHPSDEQLSQKNVLTIKLVDTKLKPITGASITLYSEARTLTTNKDGVTRYSNVEIGEHRVAILYRGQTGEEIINISPNNPQDKVSQFDLTIQLKPTNFFRTAFGIAILVGIGLIIILLILNLLIGHKRKKRRSSQNSAATLKK